LQLTAGSRNTIETSGGTKKMKNKDQHNDDANRQSLIHCEIKADKPVNTSRRNFAKSGLAVSGVLLTLSSRSALGAVTCQSPSGNFSGNVSVAHTQYTCSGLTPAQWSTNPPPFPGWPAGYSQGTLANNWTDGTLFNATNMPGITASMYDGYSMMNVLLQNPAPAIADAALVGPHIVAAYLNAISNLTNPALNATQVVAIFNEWINTNGYVPTAGAPAWTDFQIVTYLQSTMG